MFRVTTRADWDGLVSAALLSVVEDVDRYRFLEPGPFHAGEGVVTGDDLIANLPFRKGCAMWFDHHISNKIQDKFRGSWMIAPSAARVVYEYYSKDDALQEYDELIAITDRIDDAQITMAETLHPQGLILVSMTIEGKRLQDEPYWLRLIELIRKNDMRKLLKDKEVKKRCEEACQINNEFGKALNIFSEVDGNVLITDLRDVYDGEQGNRFLAFALVPDRDIWVKIFDHPNDKSRVQISVGKSIFKRTSNVNIGLMLQKYGGGGHAGAGTCRPLKEDAEGVLEEIIAQCKTN